MRFEKLASLIDVDRAIAYTLLARVWASMSGIATVVIIARFLSSVQQGYYYTFSSILALQIFVDLGLSYVIMQFASHEMARLRLTSMGTLTGEERAKARLASLLRRSIAWYGVIAVVAVFLILGTGMWLFSSRPSEEGRATWLFPWLWFVPVAISGSLLFSPILAIIEGCGLVAEIAVLRLAQGIAGTVALWFALSQDLGLLALPIFETTKLVVGVTWLAWRHRPLLADLWSLQLNDTVVDWRREIWPLQWKIALSAVSGYFIFQLFVPVLFAFHGPTLAGQMGMSLTVSTAITSIALAWVSTKAAPFGSLIAKRDYQELDRVFFRSLQTSLVLIILVSVGFWGGALFLRLLRHPLSQRLVEPLPLALLMLTTIINHVVFSLAVYLRAHKEEPLYRTSVASAILVGLSTYVLGRAYSATGMMVGYFSVTLVIASACLWIFVQKRSLWHSVSSGDDALRVS